MDQVQDCLNSIQTHLSDIEYECFIISNSEYSETDLTSQSKLISGATIVNTGKNLGYAGESISVSLNQVVIISMC